MTCINTVIFLADTSGIPLAVPDSVSENHYDLFEIEKQIAKIVADIEVNCYFLQRIVFK